VKLDRVYLKAYCTCLGKRAGATILKQLILYNVWLAGKSDGIVLQQMPEPRAHLLEKYWFAR
jgi:hypothetical protein